MVCRLTRFFKSVLPWLLINGVYAAAQSCVIKGGGILDDILLQFASVATSWQHTIEPLAQKFFFILFGMEFMWQLAVKKVFAGDIEKLWVFFFTRTVLCFFFAKYLVNIEMYKGVIVFLSGLGSSMGDFNLSMLPTSGMDTLGPSAVISGFSCMADMIHLATDQTGTLEYITIKITLAIMQVIIFIVLVAIAYYLMQVLLQAYLLIYAGFLFAGFAGSSWTRNYWERYLSAIISVGSKFLVVCLLMGVLNMQMRGWANDINQAVNSNLSILAAVIFRVCALAIIISLAIWRLPEWFATALSGQISSASQMQPTQMNGASGFNSQQSNSGASASRSNSGQIIDLVKRPSISAINPFGSKK